MIERFKPLLSVSENILSSNCKRGVYNVFFEKTLRGAYRSRGLNGINMLFKNRVVNF